MGRPKELSDVERADLLSSGFRPVEMWVPDWSDPALLERLKREAAVIAASDAKDQEVGDWVRQVRGDSWDQQKP